MNIVEIWDAMTRPKRNPQKTLEYFTNKEHYKRLMEEFENET